MIKQKKVYLIPETACELFLELQANIMEGSQFGHKDGEPGDFTAPSRKLYV